MAPLIHHLRQYTIIYLLLAGLLTPLIFGKELLFPFVVYRTYFFYVIVDLALLVWLSRGGYRAIRGWRHNYVLVALLLFLLVKIFTDMLGENPWSSIWSDYERLMGWYTWLHIGLYAFLLAQAFSVVQYRRVFMTMIAVAALVSIYGLLQHTGVAFRVRDIDPRLFSTVGNPAFLAQFLLLSGFLAAQEAARDQTKAHVWRWLAADAVIGWALVLTATRGALVGAYVGTVFALVYRFWVGRHDPEERALRRRVAWAGGVLLFLPIGMVALAKTPIADYSLTLSRLGTIGFAEQSVRARGFLWQSAWQAIREKPFLGYGESHARVVMDRLYDPRIFEQSFDSAHNIILDTIISHGIVGLLAAVFLLFALVRALSRSRAAGRWANGIGLGLLAAYIVQGQFIFDTLAGVIPLCAFIGYCLRLEHEAMRSRAAPSLVDRAGRSALPIRLVALASILVAFAWYTRGWQALSAVSQGHRIVNQGGSVATAVGPSVELSVGTLRQPSTEWPSSRSTRSNVRSQ